MGQRSVPAPILGRCIGVDDLGSNAPAGHLGEYALFSVRLLIKKRGQVIHAPVGQARRLPEPDVELAHFAAGHVGQHPLEDDPACFVTVQTQVQHLPQETAALTASVSVGPTQGAGQRVGRASRVRLAVPEPRDDVPRGQQPQSDHGCVGGLVYHPIHLSGLKSPFHRDVRRIRHFATVHQARERPFFARDDRLRPIFVLLYGEDGIPAFQVVGGIRPVVPVGEELRVDLRQRLEGDHDLARDR